MDDEEDQTTFTWVTFKFRTMRIIDNTFSSNSNVLKAELVASEEVSEADISIAMEKIHFWFDQVMPASVMFSRDNEYALDVMFDEHGVTRANNFAMLMPDEPSDDVLVRILHSKLNALAGEHIMFGMMELTSDTREQLMITFLGDGQSDLPDMDEWVGERRFDEIPWWARNDGDTLDAFPSPDDDLSKKPELGFDLSFIEQQFKKPNDVAIVVRPQFKPEIISGGKDADDTSPKG